MKDNLLPADVYKIVNQSVLTEVDKKNLTSLYQPIIGASAVSLYLTLWGDLDKTEQVSDFYTHHHLMVVLKSRLDKIEEARKALEAVGLMKSFIKRNESVNEYLYELYSPLSAYEFFNDPLLNVVLLNNIGEEEYSLLKENYKKRTIKKDDFEEITTTMNETFKSIPSTSLEEIRKTEKLGLNIESRIDFDLVEKSIPKGLINSRTFNKRVREVINKLSFTYNIDTIKMIEIIRMSIEDIGLINKEKLIETARKNYEYNNNGRLPTIIYRCQPEYLKSPTGDTSSKGRMIAVFENTTPNDFLRGRNNGAAPSKVDLQTLESLAINYDLPAGVINVLVDYVLKVNDNKLTRNYIEQIASTFKRKNIKTVLDAMNELRKKNHKTESVSKTNITKQKVNVPSWVNADIESNDLSEEDIKRLEEDLKEFR